MSLTSEKAKKSDFNIPKILFCQYCNKQCKNKNSLKQHECRCKENPNKINTIITDFNTIGHTAWNKGLTKDTDSRIEQGINTYRKNQDAGIHTNYGHAHTDTAKQKLREAALKNGLGGFHMRRGIYYNGIKLDSSYEVMVAESLDNNNIRWERCERFPYYINNILHYYTPDFYLPEYDVYLDPKNDFLIKNINQHLGFSDFEKIEAVQKQNNIKVIILNKDQLDWKSIKEFIAPIV